MNHKKVYLFSVVLLTFQQTFGRKLVILFDEKVEVCSEPDETAGFTGYDNLEVIMESDNDIFLNGSVKFPKGMTAPWKGRFYAEQYIRSQWVTSGVDRRIPDICASM